MNASEVIDEIQGLSDAEVAQVYRYLFSTERELDRVLAAFDRLPRAATLTEEEILALPRAPGSAR